MNNPSKKKRVIGLMSGTSLDGLDLVCADFWQENEKFNYQIIAADCIAYETEWHNVLQNAHLLSAQNLLALDVAFGNYLGQMVNHFIAKNKLKEIDFISSHGHTVFHQPEMGFTLQIGHGAHLQAETKLTVICDFRSQDVALGGQGAPLVPIGDRLLFAEYVACVNLGGFSNISFEKDNQRIAFDICPVNFVLNHLARKIGKPYDFNGNIAKNAQVAQSLLSALNAIPYYQQPPPKSLGREWVEKNIFPILNNFTISTEDKLATFTNHAAFQTADVLKNDQLKITLFSGGGALNQHFIQLIKSRTKYQIHVADTEILNFKEALIFAFLGYLKSQNQTNILASVTGAQRNSSSGVIYS